MPYQEIEDSRFYQRAERLADAVWQDVSSWSAFARNTVGRQLVGSADSIGANIAEGHGRQHANDTIRFLHIARGSLRETTYWLRRAEQRGLITSARHQELKSELNQLAREINAYIRYQRSRTIKEPPITYTLHQPTSQLANQPTSKPAN